MIEQLFSDARSDNSLVILEGFHSIKHAVRFGAEIETIVSSGLQDDLEELAPDIWPTIQKRTKLLSEKDFAKVTSHPTKLAAIAKRKHYSVEELFRAKKPIVLLENPRRLNNVGAAIRVSAAAEAAGLIILGDADPWHPEAIRGAAGLQFALPVIRADETPAGRQVLAADPEGKDLSSTSIPDNSILVFGTERSGVSRELLQRADQRLKIPMRTGVSSLNLATSVAVMLYAWRLGKLK